MNTILIVGLIMAACVPIALLGLRSIFGKSIVFRVGSTSVFILFLFGFLMFYAGMKGINHLYWIIPIILNLYVGSYLVIKNTISKPLKKTTAQLKAITEGDLNVDIQVSDSEDELGIINNSLLQLVEVLNKIITEISINSDNLVSASQQMSSASEELSRGASEQASSIEEVSSTVEQISSNIQQNTENAQQSEIVSAEANKSFMDVAEKAKGANEANQNIANKINIINDIAFQTNILALNAAVEAARAGEHGRGFAVVATEVRKLAENSKIAAEQIVVLTKTSIKMGQLAGDLMMNTLPKIDNTVKLAQEISAASKEQNSGISQVNNAIQQLSSITQQNASSSEELATSAEQLAAQAEQLKESISFFKISANENSRVNSLKYKQTPKSNQGMNKPVNIKRFEKPVDSDDAFTQF